MAQRPNIVFIMLDDFGWKDTSVYGSQFYETPNMDRIAREGMMFSDAYASCPVCSPTRASVMTGKYPATVGITDWINWKGNLHPAKGRLIDVPYLKDLPQSEFSVARALKEGGYQAWHVGKWHLGGPGYHPDDHGFDVNVGGCEFGCPTSGYFSPWSIPVLDDPPEGTYLPDYLGDKAAALVRASAGEPFFLNYWPYLVHTPLQAKADKIAKYEKKARDMGLDKVKTFEEGDFFPCEHKKGKRILRRLVQSDPVYAAMIESADENIGKVLDALDEMGIADNTIVMFTSDNGGLATAEGSPTSNAPLSEGKGWMYEGGTREPLMVRWPGVVAAGSTCDVPVTSTDFYPTMLDMAGLALRPEQHEDGESIVPLLKQEGGLERDAIFWHYPHYGNQGGTPGSSVRMGDFKLIEFFETGACELYNLREDIGEKHDLASEMPEKAEEMTARLHAWRDSIEAKIPQPNPDFVPWRDCDLKA